MLSSRNSHPPRTYVDLLPPPDLSPLLPLSSSRPFLSRIIGPPLLSSSFVIINTQRNRVQQAVDPWQRARIRKGEILPSHMDGSLARGVRVSCFLVTAFCARVEAGLHHRPPPFFLPLPRFFRTLLTAVGTTVAASAAAAAVSSSTSDVG